MNVTEIFKEEMNKSPKEINENTNKQWREKNKKVQSLKVEIESIRKTQTEGNLNMKNLITQTETSEASLTKRI